MGILHVSGLHEFNSNIRMHKENATRDIFHKQSSMIQQLMDVQDYDLVALPCIQTETPHFRRHSSPAGSPHSDLSSCLTPGTLPSPPGPGCPPPHPSSPSSAVGRGKSINDRIYPPPPRKVVLLQLQGEVNQSMTEFIPHPPERWSFFSCSERTINQ